MESLIALSAYFEGTDKAREQTDIAEQASGSSHFVGSCGHANVWKHWEWLAQVAQACRNLLVDISIMSS
jgi:hypothetical protein